MWTSIQLPCHTYSIQKRSIILFIWIHSIYTSPISHIYVKYYVNVNTSIYYLLVYIFSSNFLFLSLPFTRISQNQISWIRRRDWHILSSGAQMYTNDERFAILHTPGSNTWTLQIKFVQRRDHGMYECQVRYTHFTF